MENIDSKFGERHVHDSMSYSVLNKIIFRQKKSMKKSVTDTSWSLPVY